MENEFENRKLELEILKVRADIFRSLVLIVLTLGAGFFTVIFYLYGKPEGLLKALIIIGGTIEIVFILLSVVAYLRITNKINYVEKEIKKV